jgi:hypothetical protein
MEAETLVSVFVPSDETDGARGDTATLMKRAPAGALFLCAGHVRQLGGESPLTNLMEVKV